MNAAMSESNISPYINNSSFSSRLLTSNFLFNIDCLWPIFHLHCSRGCRFTLLTHFGKKSQFCLRRNCFSRLLIQGDQKVYVHLMITIQKVTSNVKSAWQPTARARGTLDSLMPSVIPNSNCVIMVSD
jgi:hypothetical protein